MSPVEPPVPRRRVLIVDDHPVVRSGLAELIADEPDLEVCGEAEGAPQAMKLVHELRPDLVVVDLSLREGSGIELIKQIHAYDPEIKMVVSSMHDEAIFGERTLAAGAMGYVDKQQPTARLIEAIRQALSGRVFVSGRLAGRLAAGSAARGRASGGSPIERLSDRELEVLQLIGEGLTSRMIAERLHLSIKTIDTYRENLKTKLGLRTANELVRYAVAWTLEGGRTD